MKIKFQKYQGAGNDFIIIDNRKASVNLDQKQIALLCHRRFGIGADGLMLLEDDTETDFRMKYYNSDGKEGSMCGNGGRCIVAFAKALGIDKQNYRFTAIDGLHEAKFDSALINLKMNDVLDIKKIDQEWFLNTGSPHVVKWVEQIDTLNVEQKGQTLRYDNRFGKSGTNVNFIEQNDNCLKIRTFERGVEAETLACGTGAVASAIIAHLQSGKNSYRLEALGGTLEVSFENDGNKFFNIWLKGPAEKVFDGEIKL